MEALSDHLRQNSPKLPTREALVLIGLQNDFLGPAGKLTVTNSPELIVRINALVPRMRLFTDIIWVCTEIRPEEEVMANQHDEATVAGVETGSRVKDEDQDHYLQHCSTLTRPCLTGTVGIELHSDIKELREGQDLFVIKHRYSALDKTTLLTSLRSRMITKIFICGALTNVSVYATALDAARCGIETVLVRDCLGYRSQERHDQAIEKLMRYGAASLASSRRILDEYENGVKETESMSDAEDFGKHVCAAFGSLSVDVEEENDETRSGS